MLQLMREATHSPVMGEWLTRVGFSPDESDKTDPNETVAQDLMVLLLNRSSFFLKFLACFTYFVALLCPCQPSWRRPDSARLRRVGRGSDGQRADREFCSIKHRRGGCGTFGQRANREYAPSDESPTWSPRVVWPL